MTDHRWIPPLDPILQSLGASCCLHFYFVCSVAWLSEDLFPTTCHGLEVFFGWGEKLVKCYVNL